MVVKIKCIILCAGYGTRLYPLTLNTPKPLLDIAGKLMIEHILLKLYEIEQLDMIFIVTNNKFYENFNDWLNTYKTNIPIKIINDKTTSNENRLGAIGDINFVVNKESINDDIIVIGGDNLFDLSLKEFINFSKGKPLIASYDINDKELAKLYGILSVDDNFKITSFEEKPQKPTSTLASTCIYFFPSPIIKIIDEYIKKGNPTDKTGNFVQWLYKKTDVHSFITKEKWFDIGNHDQLEEVRRLLK